jgi:ABC-type branched-subunit amino acid transport system substrate-binding protein
MKRRLLACPLALSLALVAGTAAAQDVGVTERTVLIGRVTPRGSPVFGAMAKQRTGAADAYIAAVNAAGGVNGRRIVLKDRDDAYNPEQAAREAKALIEEDKVFALLGAFGTPTLPVVMKLAESAGVPLVGAVTLSEEARVPLHRFVFPVRASALNETRTTVQHQLTLGINRFVVLSSKEAYGPEGALAYRQSLQQAKTEPAAVIEFSVKDDPAAVAKRIFDAKPQALLASVLPKPFAPIYKQYVALGGNARVFGFSAIRIEDMQAELGPLADGVVLSQALPVPTRRSVPLVSEFNRVLAEHAKGTPPSYHGIDAYLEARVLVEGLRRAGPALTRTRLVAALEQLNNVDFGGVTVRYGPNDRSGSSYVDLVMLRNGGVVY